MTRSLHIQHETPGGPGGGATPPAPPAPPAQHPAPAATAPPAGSNGVPGATTPPAGQPAGAPSIEDRVKVLESQLTEARGENAKARVRNREMAKMIAKLTGEEIADGAQVPDINTLSSRIDKMDADHKSEVRRLKVESALKDQYVKHGVDPELTRDVLHARGLLDALDPDTADFGKLLDATVKDLSVKHANLKVGQAGPPPANTASLRTLPPGNSGVPQLSREQIAGMAPEEVVKARKDGQLDQLLGKTK